MGLEGLLKKNLNDAKKHFGDGKLEQYITKKVRGDLSHYFKNITDPAREKLESTLMYSVGKSVQKYRDMIKDWKLKVANPLGLGVIVNDIYGFAAGIPVGDILGTKFLLQGAKTLFELPGLYNYFKKEHDLYGVIKYALMKPVGYLLPVVGPFLERNYLKKMFKNRAVKYAKKMFLKSIGQYESVLDKLKKRVRVKKPRLATA
jgi:hypothetical protein